MQVYTAIHEQTHPAKAETVEPLMSLQAYFLFCSYSIVVGKI